MPLATLTLAECPLLRPADQPVIDDYNRVAELTARLRVQYPVLAEDLTKAEAELANQRGKLIRDAYRVGFLGTTGAGKSTTFNNILGVGKDDSPACAGQGDATTSAVTRLRPSKDGKNSLQLRYLTPVQYRQKRAAICGAVKVGAAKDDAELLVELDAHRAAVHAGKADGLQKDIDSLALTLRSYQAYKSYVREPAFSETKEYADRFNLLNHNPVDLPPGQPPPPPKPSALYLLREAEIHFGMNSNAVPFPRELEMIDLPGLGSQGAVDSLLTLDFLADLDGALIFLRADQLSDANAEEILKKLKPIFDGRWSKRIWIIATKFDGLADEHLPPATRSWFDALGDFLARHQLPEGNVTVVCNVLYKDLTFGRDNHAPDVLRVINLKRSRTAAVFARYPKYSAAIDAVYDDGGIARLRTLLTQTLAVQVGQEVVAAVRLRLADLETGLVRMEQLEQRRQKMGAQEFAHAQTCRTEVYRHLIELTRRPVAFENATAKLAEGLVQVLEKSTPMDILRELPLPGLADDFATTSNALEKQFKVLLEVEVLHSMYGLVAERLKGLPEVAAAKQPTVFKAWEHFQDDDLAETASWRQRLPTFRDDVLFGRLTRPGVDAYGFGATEYRALVEEKIRQVSEQAAHLVRCQVRSRLQTIEQELAALIRQPAAP